MYLLLFSHVSYLVGEFCKTVLTAVFNFTVAVLNHFGLNICEFKKHGITGFLYYYDSSYICVIMQVLAG